MAKITIEELSGSLKEYLNGLGLTEAQVQELIDSMQEEVIGSKEELATNDKSSIVAAINELFQSANNGKELIASAIGEPLNAEDTFSAMSTDINGLLSTFKANMMNNGVTVESGDKFKSLIDKIATMVEEGSGKGIQFASGIVASTDLNNKISFSYLSGGSTSWVYAQLPKLDFDVSMIVYMCEYTNHIGIVDKLNTNSILFTQSDETQSFLRDAFVGRFKIDNSVFNGSVYKLPLANPSSSVNVKYYAIGVGEEDTTLRDSLASILTGEGVNVTEEDDMASLISKVDEEFDVQNNEISSLNTNITLLTNQVNSLTSELAGKVTPAGDAVAGNVLSGKTFINSTGQLVTGTMANRGGAQTVTPGTSNKTLNAGYYSGNITVAGDADLVAANIASGKNIFGVSGTLTAKKTKSGTYNVSGSSKTMTVTGLGFKPTFVSLNGTVSFSLNNLTYVLTIQYILGLVNGSYICLSKYTHNYSSGTIDYEGYANSVTDDGFTITVYNGQGSMKNINLNWIAYS